MKKILVAAVFIPDSLVLALEGQIGIHDPSTVIFCDGKYYTYGTGGTSLVSDDGWAWRRMSLIGSNAASVGWVNGKEVIGIYGDRQTVIDDGVSKRLTLNKGPNVVRAAIANGGGATGFCARFLDDEDRPLKEITVSLGEIRRAPSR
jgi:hypothetical protein